MGRGLELKGRLGHSGAYKDPVSVFRDLNKELDDFALQKIPVILKRAVKRYLDKVYKDLASKHGNPYSASAIRGDTLQKRSGNAIASIEKSISVEGGVGGVIGKIGGVHYLRSHEYGAVIRAKKSKYLTIPLPPAMDGRGIPKKRSARDWQNTFVIKSKKGNLLIVHKVGKKIEPLYVLKKQVIIPKRLGMRKAIDENYEYFFTYLSKEINKEFKL